jgi:hypothetical protein
MHQCNWYCNERVKEAERNKALACLCQRIPTHQAVSESKSASRICLQQQSTHPRRIAMTYEALRSLFFNGSSPSPSDTQFHSSTSARLWRSFLSGDRQIVVENFQIVMKQHIEKQRRTAFSDTRNRRRGKNFWKRCKDPSLVSLARVEP